EQPQERACCGRADADADEVPAPLAHVAVKYARWSGTADEARTAVLRPARGRDRPRRLCPLPACEPSQTQRGGASPGGEERRAGGRSRAAPWPPPRAGAPGPPAPP